MQLLILMAAYQIFSLLSLMHINAKVAEKMLLHNTDTQVLHRVTPSDGRSRHQENITEKLLGDWSKSNLFMAGMRSWERPLGGSGIESALTVACRRKKMVAHMRKDILLAFGYSTAKLTLRDPHCKAESNCTHFLLNSPLTSCGTQRLVDLDSAPTIVLYQNAILLWTIPSSTRDSSDYEDTKHAEKEDPRVINFTCVYPVLALFRSSDLRTAPDPSPHTSHSLLRLEVCSSHISSKHSGPCLVASNSRVFVEVFLSPLDPGVGFSLQMCFVSPSSDPWVQSEYLLVCGACPADATVSFSIQHPGNKERQRLSFLLQPVYNESIQFLHCQLSLHHGEDTTKACTKEVQDSLRASTGYDKVAACIGTGEMLNRSQIRIVSKPMIVTIGGELGATVGHDTPSQASGWNPPLVKEDRRPSVRVGLLQTGECFCFRIWDDYNRRVLPLPSGAANMAGCRADRYPVLSLEAIIGIVLAAFAIGALLMAGLWFIYSQTETVTSLSRPSSSLVLDKVVKDTPGCITHVWDIPEA